MDFVTCPWQPAQYWIFSENTAPLLFYSHIPAMFIGLVIALTVFIKNKASKLSVALVVISVLFFFWGFFDLIIWATNNPSTVIFFWSMQILIEPFIYITAFTLTYIFRYEKDINFKWKVFLFLLCLPIIVLLPTRYNLIGVYISYCDAIEGFIASYYTYFVEVVCIGLILWHTWVKNKSNMAASRKSQEVTFGLGILLFLSSFSWGNIVGTFSENWKVAQFGLIGMPIFVAFLAYLIVKYKILNIKLIATQALLGSTWFMIFSVLFLRDADNIKIVILLTLAVLSFLGIFLIRSVKREVQQRQQLELLSKQLANANEQLKVLDQARAEFISIASHQLRTPPATVKWYLSALLAGDFGNFTQEQKSQLQIIQQTNNGLISLIEDLLNVSRIERGTMEFLFSKTDVSELANLAFKQLAPMAQEKKLDFTLKISPNLPTIMADKEKLRQVMNNLMDNAIKYTLKGFVHVALEEKNETIFFSVLDSGKGMEAEEKIQVFEKFKRGKDSEQHSAGLGLGLYVAKIIIEQHKGKIWAESPGKNLGSSFVFSLPKESGLKETTLLDLTKK